MHSAAFDKSYVKALLNLAGETLSCQVLRPQETVPRAESLSGYLCLIELFVG